MYLILPTNTLLALVLLNLATPTSLQYVEHLFVMGKITNREVVLELCGALQDMLAYTVLHVHNP